MSNATMSCNGTAEDRAAVMAIEHRIGTLADPADVPPFYAGERAILYDALMPGSVRGADAICDAFAAQLVGTTSVSTELEEHDLHISGDLAVLHSIQRLTVEREAGGSSEVVCRVTDVFERDGDTWRILHQHISYGIDPATGKAIFFSPATAQESQSTE